jgi:tetrapyrrole methylase family protein/MazG family protein
MIFKKLAEQEYYIHKLITVMKYLRSPDGCPWDRKQTHESLKPFLVEEAAELLDAIDEKNPSGVCEELGDVLMHVVLHSVMAEEEGDFTFEDVARESTEKMLRRHPHVFDNASVDNAEEVVGLWEQVKKQEKKGKEKESVLDGIPRNLPALLQAEKIQKKAAVYGFDWSSQEQVLEKVEEELEEIREALRAKDNEAMDEEIGDLLFAVVNLIRFREREKNSEDLLVGTIDKFKYRFKHIEKSLKAQNKTLEEASLDEMENLWQEAKSLKRG